LDDRRAVARGAGDSRKKPVGATGFPKAESYQRDRPPPDAARRLHMLA